MPPRWWISFYNFVKITSSVQNNSNQKYSYIALSWIGQSVEGTRWSLSLAAHLTAKTVLQLAWSSADGQFARYVNGKREKVQGEMKQLD